MQVNYGYAESPPPALSLAARIVRKLNLLPSHLDAGSASDAEVLAAVDPTFLLGRDAVVPHPKSSLIHQVLVWAFQLLLNVSRSTAVTLGIPPNMLIEIGIRVGI